MQFETRSEKRSAVLSNTIPSVSIPKVTASRTHAKFCIMDVWIFLIPKREHPPTIKANEARSSRKLVARYEETRRGNVDYRVQGIPHPTVQKEDSNRREIAKTLIQQFETHPNRDSLMEDLNSAKSRRSLSPAWVTRRTSSCARSLLKYNALIVLCIEKWHRTLHLRQMHAAVGIDS